MYCITYSTRIMSNVTVGEKILAYRNLRSPPPLPPETKVSVFGRTSANIPFGRFITAPVSVLWRPILKFSPHLADYSSKNQFPRKSSRTRECRGHVIFLHEYMVEETNPVFFFFSFFFFFFSINRIGCTKERIREENFPKGGRGGNFCDTRKKNHFGLRVIQPRDKKIERHFRTDRERFTSV